MKLVTYKRDDDHALGIFIDGHLYDLRSCGPGIPGSMNEYLLNAQNEQQNTRIALEKLQNSKLKPDPIFNAQLLAPVSYPTSCRDGYAFRQHVAAARRNRGVNMIAEFDQYPIFYFTNHQSICGPGVVTCMPDHFKQLDFELEIAIVIGKKGRNIRAADADSYIAGYMIMNDLSARTLQMEEMLLNLGPAKGKDFSTVIGPWLVTPDELEWYKVPPKDGHEGNNYNLEMICRVNGTEVSRGNMSTMDWTFAEIIERASYGCDLFPGDIIGSGTVGTGCFLELNGTALLNDPLYTPQWLQPGDVIEMEITGLGLLRTTIEADPSLYSILNLKKKNEEF
jgi:fumarylacetoacetate (FAA) hydrolase